MNHGSSTLARPAHSNPPTPENDAYSRGIAPSMPVKTQEMILENASQQTTVQSQTPSTNFASRQDQAEDALMRLANKLKARKNQELATQSQASSDQGSQTIPSSNRTAARVPAPTQPDFDQYSQPIWSGKALPKHQESSGGNLTTELARVIPQVGRRSSNSFDSRAQGNVVSGQSNSNPTIQQPLVSSVPKPGSTAQPTDRTATTSLPKSSTHVSSSSNPLRSNSSDTSWASRSLRPSQTNTAVAQASPARYPQTNAEPPQWDSIPKFSATHGSPDRGDAPAVSHAPQAEPSVVVNPFADQKKLKSPSTMTEKAPPETPKKLVKSVAEPAPNLNAIHFQPSIIETMQAATRTVSQENELPVVEDSIQESGIEIVASDAPIRTPSAKPSSIANTFTPKALTQGNLVETDASALPQIETPGVSNDFPERGVSDRNAEAATSSPNAATADADDKSMKPMPQIVGPSAVEARIGTSSPSTIRPYVISNGDEIASGQSSAFDSKDTTVSPSGTAKLPPVVRVTPRDSGKGADQSPKKTPTYIIRGAP